MSNDPKERHRWWLTPTALFRSHADPVFFRPVHWLDGCWTCAPRSPHAQELLEMETKRRERERARTARFKFAPGPSIGDLRDTEARERWLCPTPRGGPPSC
jgi:hypothetical protein